VPRRSGRSVPANGKKERVEGQTIRFAGGTTVTAPYQVRRPLPPEKPAMCWL